MALVAELPVRAVAAALAVVGRLQRDIGIEHPADGVLQQLAESLCMVADVADRFISKLQDGVVVLGASVLYEKQGW